MVSQCHSGLYRVYAPGMQDLQTYAERTNMHLS